MRIVAPLVAICFASLLWSLADSASRPASFSIQPGGGQPTVNDSGESVGLGYGRILADPDSAAPDGFAVIEFRDGGGVLLSEIALPVSEPVASGRVFAEVEGPATTVLAIANPGETSAEVRFRFTDASGAGSAAGEVVIEPGEQFASFLDRAPFEIGASQSQPASFSGVLTFESSVPVAVQALRGHSNEAGEFLLTAIPVAPPTAAGGSDAVHFPYFAAGEGWSTDIVLMNPARRAISGELRFFNERGDAPAAAPLSQNSGAASLDYSIPPGGHLKFTSSSVGAFVGSARAVPAAGDIAPQGLAITSFAANGKTVAYAGIAAVRAGTAFRVYAEAAGAAGAPGSVRLAVALANPGAAAADVELRLAELDGDVSIRPHSLTLPPLGQTVVLLDQVFDLPETHAGVLRVRSGSDVAIAAMRILVNERDELKIAATPPVNESALPGAGATIFPLALDLEGWTTRYLLFDGSSNLAMSGSLGLYDAAGRAVVGPESGRETAAVDRFAFEGLVQCGECATLDDATVVIERFDTLRTVNPANDGKFEVFGLSAGEYTVSVRKAGFRPPPARMISVGADGTVSTSSASFALHALDKNVFEFHWEEDQSTAGRVYSSQVNEPFAVEFLGGDAVAADGASADQLLEDYNITLVNQGDRFWTDEHAYRLLRTMEAIPQRQRDRLRPDPDFPASRWLIVPGHIADDIRISRGSDGVRTVRVAEDAFVNASPRQAIVNGKRGLYHSRRLHHAAARFVTDNGRDEEAFEKILKERYGVSTLIGDDADYRELTGESGHRFQQFHPEEIVSIINMLEEMPVGMHSIPGLRLLVRRLDGTPNPFIPGAPAIAWTEQGYIEFMDKAFLSNVAHMHRLILHEKAHFLWAHLFDAQLKADWTELGGWYADPNDPDGWSTTKQTEFVSAYAHKKNPDEDMAESISFFVLNPDKLRSRSLGKYEFIRDRIMQGNFYIARIREDLTFQVYNLYPDYVFPGKIREVRILAEGAPEEDKRVTVTIGLHTLDGELDNASGAYTRIVSEAGTFVDLRLQPVNGNGSGGTVLRGSVTLSKHVKAGYWRPDQISLFDEQGNERLGGINDFGWSLYIDNPLEDVQPPEYVPDTATLSLAPGVAEGREVQYIEASWEVDEPPETMDTCQAILNAGQRGSQALDEYGRYDPGAKRCRVSFVVPHYMPSSVYSLDYFRMADVALNERRVYFRPDNANTTETTTRDREIDEAAPKIQVVTRNPDLDPPALDVANIQISGEPTRPEDPNGETLVTLEFRVRDNISGFRFTNLNLRDPQGIEHNFWVQPDGWNDLFPADSPSEWTKYTWSVLLPAGSAPGTWGLADMTVYDRAGNFKGHDFTEIIHFEVEN